MAQSGDQNGDLNCDGVGESLGGQEFSKEFLRDIIDALPKALVVIDRNRSIVMANHVARVRQTCLKCYQCFHHHEGPCADIGCPVEMVAEKKAPARVYHTHYDHQGRQISVAIDAAPVFDEAGEVAYTIETCRDVTERTLSRRLSRIGNRHMTMAPMLSDYAEQIRGYSGCAVVQVHLLDDRCDRCFQKQEPGNDSASDSPTDRDALSGDGSGPICVRSFADHLASYLPVASEDGGIHVDHFTRVLASLPAVTRDRLGECVPRDCESFALVPVHYGQWQIGLVLVADPRRT